MPGRIDDALAARRAAAEAARRAAAEAARRAAAEAARRAVESAARAQTARRARLTNEVSEFSQGRGQPLREFSRAAIPSVGQVPPATSLRTEQLRDGDVNCLERAQQVARPGDDLVLLKDRKDAAGHAIVQRPDGSVVDPNTPDVRYPSLTEYQAALPRYSDPVVVKAADATAVLQTPPGAARDALISRLGLDGVADRLVADPKGPSWASQHPYVQLPKTEPLLGPYRADLIPAVTNDATTVAKAFEEGGPQAAASTLQTLLHEHANDQDYQGLLLTSTRPVVRSIVSNASEPAPLGALPGGNSLTDEGKAALGSLAAAYRDLQPAQQTALAGAIASSTSAVLLATGTSAYQLSQTLAEGGVDNLALLRGLAGAYRTQGNQADATTADRIADGVANAQLSKLAGVRGDYEGAKKTVDALNEELGYLVNEYKDGLPVEQLNAAIADFREKHKAEYEAFDHAAAALGEALTAAGPAIASYPAGQLPDEVKACLSLVPSLAGTPAGKDAIAGALIDQGEGRPTFLDGIKAYSDGLGEEEKKTYLEGVQGALLEGLSAGQGTVDDAHRHALYAGLEKNAAVLGLEPEQTHELTESLEAVASATTPEQINQSLDALSRTFEGSGAAAGNTRLGQLFRVAALGALATGVARADPQNAKERVAAFANGLSLDAGSAQLALDVIGHRASEGSSLARFAEGGAKWAGRTVAGANAVLAVVDALRSVEAFSEGKPVEGTSAALIATGETVLAGATLAEGLVAAGVLAEGVPVAGTIAGVCLIVGGIAVSLLGGGDEEKAHEFEDSGETFLKAAGLRDDIAHELSRRSDGGDGSGKALEFVANRLGYTTEELFAKLNTLDADTVAEVRDDAFSALNADDHAGGWILKIREELHLEERSSGSTLV